MNRSIDASSPTDDADDTRYPARARKQKHIFDNSENLPERRNSLARRTISIDESTSKGHAPRPKSPHTPSQVRDRSPSVANSSGASRAPSVGMPASRESTFGLSEFVPPPQPSTDAQPQPRTPDLASNTPLRSGQPTPGPSPAPSRSVSQSGRRRSNTPSGKILASDLLSQRTSSTDPSARRAWAKYAVADEVLVYPALITDLPLDDERNTTHVKVTWLDGDQDLTVIPDADVIRTMTAGECAFVDECVTLQVHGGVDITMTECEALMAERDASDPTTTQPTFTDFEWPGDTPYQRENWAQTKSFLCSNRFNPHSLLHSNVNTVWPLPPRAHKRWMDVNRRITDLFVQCEVNSPEHHKIYMLWKCLPRLILTVGRNEAPHAQSRRVCDRCTKFLSGRIETLFNDAKKPRNYTSQVNPPPQTDDSIAQRTKQAMQYAQRGNLSKAHSILTSIGIANGSDDELVELLQAKHPPPPPNAPPMPARGHLVHLDHDTVKTWLHRGELASQAGRTLAGKAGDQWGWRAREHLAPLLHDVYIGEYLVSHVFEPIIQGDFLPLTDDHLIGGKLFALRKKDGGIRPILIGDTDRKVATKALMRSQTPYLSEFFLTAHPRVTQFAVGIRDGAAKTLHTLTSILPSVPTIPSGALSDIDKENPVACVSLDARNAYNCMSRVAIFDAIYGKASRAYDDGNLLAGSPLPHPDSLQPYLRCLEMYYGRPAFLGFAGRDGRLHKISGQTGIQQGDPPSSAMYCLGQHPTLMRVADRHAEVYLVAYADNVFIVGRLDKALACADDLADKMSSDLDLDINLRESWVYVPAWAHQTHTPPSFATHLAHHPRLEHITLRMQGTTLLGSYLGTPEFRTTQLDTKTDTIIQSLSDIRCIPDGKVHYQLTRFCIHSKLHFLFRCTPPSITRAAAARLDSAVAKAIIEYAGASFEHLVEECPKTFAMVCAILQMPHRKGGWGLSPLAGICTTAFLASTADFLRWRATALPALHLFPSFQFDATNPRSSTNSFFVEFVGVYDYLVRLGAEVIEIVGDVGAEEPRAEPGSEEGISARLKLPSLPLLSSDTKMPVVPRQREVTAFVLSKWQPHGAAIACAPRHMLDVMEAQKETVADCSEKETSPLLKVNFDIAKPSGKLRYAPTAFLREFDVGPGRAFPKAEWQVWANQSLGLPNPHVTNHVKIGIKNCKCGRVYDEWGHHVQTCGHRTGGAWRRVHENVNHIWREVASMAKLDAVINPAELPRPTTEASDKHADILFPFETLGLPNVVGDVSLAHPFDGGSRRVKRRGTYKPEVFKQRIDVKNRKYYDYHKRQGIVFVPLVGTTFGRINADSVILCHVLAHHAAEEFYKLRGWTFLDPDTGKIAPGFLRLRSRFFSRYKGRIGLSICRAAGSRGMMSGPTFSVRSRKGVLRTSDLDYGEDLPAGHQSRAEAA